jgi:hypothetical protein
MRTLWRPHRQRVTDTTLNADDLRTEDGLRRVLSRLVGQRLEQTCLRESETCSAHPDGPCQGCLARDQFVRLVDQTPWTQAKLNQALLLMRRDPVSSDFFDAFFGGDSVDDAGFLSGIAQLRAYAMLVFGSFRLAFEELGRRDRSYIRERLGRWAKSPGQLQQYYRTRPHGKTLVRDIAADKRWHLGYLSGRLLENDQRMHEVMTKKLAGKPLAEDEQKLGENLSDDALKRWEPQLDEIEEQLDGLEAELQEVRAIGLANTHAYLAANHIDIYVATSMRERWEFVAVAGFVHDVFEDPAMKRLADLTPFDPTLAFSADRVDKGLLEGLMLRRARCTLYMVQEADTLGKDSELAATLALGRVVIAYVPESVPANAYDSSVDFLRKRALTLLAEQQYASLDEAAAVYKNLAPVLDEAARTEFKLVRREEADFREKYKAELAELVSRTVEAEGAFLNSRARTLKQSHPLALQVELVSGVANGVLVARTPAQCADLAARALTNELEFKLVDSESRTDGQPSATLLLEASTQCAFRVVTNHTLLTSSFWSLYATDEEEIGPDDEIDDGAVTR